MLYRVHRVHGVQLPIGFILAECTAAWCRGCSHTGSTCWVEFIKYMVYTVQLPIRLLLAESAAGAETVVTQEARVSDSAAAPLLSVLH